MPQFLLGIDNGGTVSKAALFTLTGDEVAVAGRKVKTVAPHERDANALWHGTAEAIREVIAQSGIHPRDILCVAGTGHGNGLYLVGHGGQPVRNGIYSTDNRAQRYIERWRAEGVWEKVLPKTAQSLWPGQPNALLAWLRDHEPQTLNRAKWALMCKDFIRFKLTGQARAELTDMSATNLMNVVTAQYDASVLEAFGLGEMQRLLPPLARTEEICGAVTAQAAAETGLVAGTPVAGGMFDVDACGLAAGLVDEQQMTVVAGTWGISQFIARQPLVDKDLFMSSCYSIPGYYLMLEASPTSAANLEWFLADYGISYDECNKLVSSAAADSRLLFVPFLYGSNAHPSAKASLVGLEGRHTRADVLRAVYEGIVFAHHWHLQRLLQFRPPPVVVRFTGGAARSDVWTQMFADCFQIPVEVPAGSELGALGAAIAAAVAAGCYPGYAEAVKAMTKIARRHEPRGCLAEKYERYRKLVHTLEALWQL